MFRDSGLDPSQPREPLFHSIIVEDNRFPIGFAYYSYAHSSFEGKTLYLMDLYVKESHREKGVGKLMIAELARHAKETGCRCVIFYVNKNSPATKYYQNLGAVDLTTLKDYHLFKFE